MQRAGEGEEDALRDLLRRDRVEPLVDGVGLRPVAAEPYERELALDETGVDRRDAYPRTSNFDAMYDAPCG